MLETPFWFSVIEKLYSNSERIFYFHSQDEVLHIKIDNGQDIYDVNIINDKVVACRSKFFKRY